MGIETDTALLPYVIADCVAWDTPLPADQHAALAVYLAERAERIYASNVGFRKRLRGKGDAGRSHLYLFMRHWAAAYLQHRAVCPQNHAATQKHSKTNQLY